MKVPYFSIIIPTLNEVEYLPLLLTDLASQTFRDYEVIIVDGKSKDQTVLAAKKFRKELPQLKVYSSPTRHVSVQRNLGAKQAYGEYLIFMDADNRLPSYFLEGIHYRTLVSQPDLFTTWCNSPDKERIGKTITSALNLMIEASAKVDFENALGALIGCKKSVFSTGAGFNPDISYAEDGEFVRRYVKAKYGFTIFHDPQFMYSLRRFQANGTLRTLQQTANLYVKQVTGQKILRNEYPMGGHVFIKSKHTIKEAIREIQHKIESLLKV